MVLCVSYSSLEAVNWNLYRFGIIIKNQDKINLSQVAVHLHKPIPCLLSYLRGCVGTMKKDTLKIMWSPLYHGPRNYSKVSLYVYCTCNSVCGLLQLYYSILKVFHIHVHFADQYKQVLNLHKYTCSIGYLSPLHEYRSCVPGVHGCKILFNTFKNAIA